MPRPFWFRQETAPGYDALRFFKLTVKLWNWCISGLKEHLTANISRTTATAMIFPQNQTKAGTKFVMCRFFVMIHPNCNKNINKQSIKNTTCRQGSHPDIGNPQWNLIGHNCGNLDAMELPTWQNGLRLTYVRRQWHANVSIFLQPWVYVPIEPSNHMKPLFLKKKRFLAVWPTIKPPKKSYDKKHHIYTFGWYIYRYILF